MNGHRLMVWVGRDGIMFVSCFSVSIVVSGLCSIRKATHDYRYKKTRYNPHHKPVPIHTKLPTLLLFVVFLPLQPTVAVFSQPGSLL